MAYRTAARSPRAAASSGDSATRRVSLDQVVESGGRVVPLSSVRAGQRAEICADGMRCDDCELLNAMGLRDQCRLRVCRAGEPYIVQVATARVGLAKSLAQRIMVRVDDDA